MIGRTPGHIVAHRPLRGGAITNFDVTQRMIRLLLQRLNVHRLTRPRVLICVPSGITPVEQRAVNEAAKRAGAANCYLIEQPVAAAVGAGLPISEARGSMVVDVGGGTSEVAVMALGGVVALEAEKRGSFDIDSAIQRYVKKNHSLSIGERTAEDIKVYLGCAEAVKPELRASVRGRNHLSGLPHSIELGSDEISAVINEQVAGIVNVVTRCLSRLTPDLSQDLATHGINLVGGGSMLRGFDQRVANSTGIPVRLVESPQEAVVRGAGWVLEHLEQLSGLLLNSRRAGTR